MAIVSQLFILNNFCHTCTHATHANQFSYFCIFLNDFIEVFVIIKKGEIVGQLALLNVQSSTLF